MNTILDNDDVVTTASRQARIFTEDPNEVGQHTAEFAFYVGTTFKEISVSVLFAISPSCAYSSIVYYGDNYNAVSVINDQKYRIPIDTSDYRHEHDLLWTSLGYPDACTIGYSLSGTAASFSSFSNNEITITP